MKNIADRQTLKLYKKKQEYIMKKKMILRINLSKASKAHKSTHSLPFDLSSGRKERLLKLLNQFQHKQ